jgi:hypothetical protein
MNTGVNEQSANDKTLGLYTFLRVFAMFNDALPYVHLFQNSLLSKAKHPTPVVLYSFTSYRAYYFIYSDSSLYSERIENELHVK